VSRLTLNIEQADFGRFALNPGRFWRAMLAAIVACLTSTPSLGQGTLSTLFDNGPQSNRVNVVVLSEGYTNPQLGQFLVDATNLVNTLLNTPPYQAYRGHCNAYAIAVASPESGSDHPLYPVFVNTYFNSAYEVQNYVITIPPNGYDANYANGQGKVDALVTNLLPHADMVLLLVNDVTPGGSSGLGGPASTGPRRPIITALNSYLPYSDIAAHESGHYFAGLVDEYTADTPGYVPVEAPNATQQTNRAQVPWNAWIEPTTPVPTPNDWSYDGVVGLFEGAQYQTTGWYRPKFRCKMGTSGLGLGFCEVCAEQIVKTIYQQVRAIDSAQPVTSNVTALNSQPVAFSVTPVQPLTHTLRVQWYTNNTAVGGATNPVFEFEPNRAGNGAHTVRAVVEDRTPLVRNDPGRLLTATNTWSVTVSLTELRLVAPLHLDGGRFRLTVTGTAPQGFVIQASTHLNNWVRLSTNQLSDGRFDWTNTGLSLVPFQFYRTVSPP
jgi:hypothetical protein